MGGLVSLVLLLALAPNDVTVRKLDGQAIVGKLVAADAKEVTVEVNGQRQSLAVNDIQDVVAEANVGGLDRTELSRRPIVELADGSRLVHTGVALNRGKAQIQTANGNVEANASQLAVIRFRNQDETLSREWQSIAKDEHQGDVLVVRKITEMPDEQGNPRTTVALDSLEGVVKEIKPELIKFEFDGDVLDVRLEKVEGILFHRTAKNSQRPLCLVGDVAGSTWQVKSLRFEQDRWDIETVSGLKTSLPGATWKQVDFSAVNTQYLSELEPEKITWSDYLERLPSLIPALPKRYELLRNEAYSGGTYSLHGHVYDRGLTVFAGSEIIYRLPESCQRLRAVAGLDDRSQSSGGIRLVLLGDGRELLVHEFSSQDQEPLAIDLGVSGVRRLVIRVEYGSRKLQTGSLDLCDLRVTK